MFDEIETATDLEVFEILGRYITEDVSLVEAAIKLSVAPEILRENLNEYDIEVREPSKEELVRDAATCLHPKDDEEGYYYEGEDEKQLEEAVSAIIERLNVDPRQFHLSEQGLRRVITEAIWESKSDEEQTAEVFWSEMDDIHRHLGTQDRTTFNIVFPLNLIYEDVDRPDEYQCLSQTVQAISSDVWETCCEWAHMREEEEAEESDAINARNDLEDRFTDAPNQLDRGGQTYWMVEIEALDREFAMDRCDAVLRFLLGRINFALTRGKFNVLQGNSGVWNTRWMDLRLPFIYLVFEDNEYASFYYSTDPTPRNRVSLFGRKADRYQEYFDEIPPLNRDRDPMERRLVTAFQSFQDAVTNTDAEEAFLDYWRAAERLTLTSETDSTSEVIQRARTVARTSNVVSQSEVREKRNKLVHEGESVEITTEDTNTVKGMLEDLILLYVDRSADWIKEDFLFFFEHGDKSEAALDDLEAKRQADIDRIEEMRQM